jgi:hypothetical protein
MKLQIAQFSPTPVTTTLFRPNILLYTLFSKTFSLCSPLNIKDQVSHPHKLQAALYTCIFYILCKWSKYCIKLHIHNSANNDHSMWSFTCWRGRGRSEGERQRVYKLIGMVDCDYKFYPDSVPTARNLGHRSVATSFDRLPHAKLAVSQSPHCSRQQVRTNAL